MQKKSKAQTGKAKKAKAPTKHIRVLLIEDAEDDALLIIRELKKGGYKPTYQRLETAAAMKKALREKQWDVILSDYKLPKFNAIHAISLLREAKIDIPLIVVSSTIGEQITVKCMKAGALDYVMKDNLMSLCSAIDRELKEAEIRIKQRKDEEALFRSQLLLNETQKITKIGGWEYDVVNRRMFWTDETYRIYGVSKDFDKNNIKQYIQFYSVDDQKIIGKAFQETVKKGIPYDLELKLINAHGKHLWVRTIGRAKKKQGKIVRVFGYIHDITERKKAEDELRRNADQLDKLNQQFVFILAATHTNTDIIDADFNLIYVDKQWQETYGNPKGRKCYEYFMGRNKMCPSCAIPMALKTKKVIVTEEVLPRENNRIIEVHTIPFHAPDNTWQVAEFNIDITRRKNAEEKLRQSEYRLDRAMAVKNEGIWDWNIVTNETFFDDRHYTMAGYAPNEFPNNFKGWTERVHPDDLPEANSAIQEYLLGKSESLVTEFRLKHKNGSWIWIHGQGMIAARDANGTPIRMIGTHTDITERKATQEKLRQSEEKYRLILENIQEGYYEVDLAGNITFCNAAMASIADCPPEELMGMNYHFYTPEKNLKKVFATFNQVFRSGNPSTGFDWEIIRKSGEVRHIEASVSLLKDAYGKSTGFRGLVRDITEKKQIEAERQENMETLSKALGATINAMAVTVETRDPYTAGHQRRVAHLARAIATEMKLSNEQIDAVRMASVIHDIGKISIPSEILTKPTQLSELEYNLIKTHPSSGHSILKDIEFPWPIARIVLEHHERVDGSGYPCGLKGEEILLEARIVAVADVVEAISSHRPYRAAHGIETGLQEIEKNKGKLYDTFVVDACLRLFREKHYNLDD